MTEAKPHDERPLLKFVTDGMLGKLTRWLRMLGHDVEYVGSIDDKDLMARAKKESRILLTRDLELYRQAITKGAEAFLIESPNQTASLASLARRFGFKLEVDAKVSRCPKCNGELCVVSKSNIAVKIPATTSSNYDEFWQCQNCGQVFWRGAHWQKIEKTLAEAKKTLATLT
ncbi:MAG TPA: Mut7-C RNAse domain-containing protein [Candidatus Bathyarchaeia archaeon]|nr:Mut7-C RNAse domain-containing protein [Candidatus Bathyarchaeia archaeon]